MAVGNIPLYIGASEHDVGALLSSFDIPHFSPQPTTVLPTEGLYLQFDEQQRLSLYQGGQKGSVCVDFVSGRLDYRRQKGGGELIAKAINTKQHQQLIDATAGLGRDAFILASQGCNVTLFEQHPVVAALLSDGLRRALSDEQTQDIAQRMRLMAQSFVTAEHTQAPPVVYLDPMYPHRQKSAAVKKEMAYFHDLVGQSDDDARLLLQAAKVAQKRVVVKRPRLGEFLAQQQPDYQYTGKSTRFDVYLPNKLQDALA